MFLDTGDSLINEACIARIDAVHSADFPSRVRVVLIDGEGVKAPLNIDEAKQQLTNRLLPPSRPFDMTSVSIYRANRSTAELIYRTKDVAAFRWSPYEDVLIPVDTNGESPEAGHYVVHQADGSVLGTDGHFSSLEAWKLHVQKSVEREGRTFTVDPQPFHDWTEEA